MGSRRTTDRSEAESGSSDATTPTFSDLGLPSLSGNATNNVAVDRADIIPSIKSYLEVMVSVRQTMVDTGQTPSGWAFNSIEQLLLQRGTLFPVSRFTLTETFFLRKVFEHFDEPARLGDCYQVAGDLTMHAEWLIRDGRWSKDIWSVRYAEGLGMAHSSALPVGHAVMLLNEKPVDIVWREKMGEGARDMDEVKSISEFMRRAKWCLEHNVYWMLQVLSEQYLNYIAVKKTYGVLDDWEATWPFVRLGPELAVSSRVLDSESTSVVK